MKRIDLKKLEALMKDRVLKRDRWLRLCPGKDKAQDKFKKSKRMVAYDEAYDISFKADCVFDRYIRSCEEDDA